MKNYNNTVTLSETELKNIVKESVEKILKEGTTIFDDGVYNYQGTGSPESKERMKKISRKRKYNRFDIDYMNKAFQYDGNLSDDNSSVYRLLHKFSMDVDSLYEELLTKLEKVNLDDETRKELNDLTWGARHLAPRLESKGLLKRNFAGEPNPYYKEK